MLGALGYPWFFAGFGLALLGVGLGYLVYRDRRASGNVRVVGAVALGVSAAAAALAGARIALTILALDKVQRWLGG
ncbi:MAG: hypothetical protein IPL79_04230 [Myxococcales bacterium]|nr:hypothetical protein [Myxococcales bacterium]